MADGCVTLHGAEPYRLQLLETNNLTGLRFILKTLSRDRYFRYSYMFTRLINIDF